MANIKQIEADLALMDQMKNISEAYEEISIINIKKTRNIVVGTREFIDAIRDIYKDVKYSHDRLELELQKKSKKVAQKRVQAVKELNTKPLAILLTPNAKMYGDIVRLVFNEFYSFIQNREVDIAIVGKLGYEMLQEVDPKRQCMFFEVQDKGASAQELKPVLYNILAYETVSVFHGRYQTVITQVPTVSSIAGKDIFEDPNEKFEATAKNHNTQYLFEPAIESIAAFFGEQFFSVMFEQAYHESQLAQYASRLRAMEAALDRVNDETESLMHMKRRINRRVQNKKQSERLAGIFFAK